MARVLFATMPFDGHFNPLTGLAVQLLQQGHDVRWYTGPSYAARLAKLGIPHLQFRRAREVNAQNLATLFPEYERLGNGPKAIEFALRELFFGNLEAHYRDVAELHAGDFAFDALVCDAAFFASRIVAEKLQPRVYAIGVAPTPAPTSRCAPPPFFGLKPARSIFGRIRDRVVTALLERTNRKSMPILDDLRAREGLPPYRGSVFDLHVESARAIFQIGAPALDFPRDDWPANLQFVGALLPHREPRASTPLGHGIEEKLARYGKMVVVSQGTVDNRDPSKLFEPCLTALRGTEQLVVATTGHQHTSTLAERFAADNVVVADWIDFDPLLQRADVFVCNGGYGSVMTALTKGVPVVLAGKLEGKIDVNARVDWFGAGVDLRTERPTARRVGEAVQRVLADAKYRAQATRARDELARYDGFAIIAAKLRADGL